MDSSEMKIAGGENMQATTHTRKKSKQIRLIVFDAVMAALGVVLMLTIRFPLIPLPGAAHLLYDMGDIPAMLAGIIAGPSHGLVTLLIIALVQLLTPNSNGFIGFLMHFIASGALVIIPSLFWKYWKNNKSLIAGFVLGAVALVGIMIPMNMVATPLLFNVPLAEVQAMIFPILIPFNLLKGLLSGVITYLVFKALGKASDGKIERLFDED